MRKECLNLTFTGHIKKAREARKDTSNLLDNFVQLDSGT